MTNLSKNKWIALIITLATTTTSIATPLTLHKNYKYIHSKIDNSNVLSLNKNNKIDYNILYLDEKEYEKFKDKVFVRIFIDHSSLYDKKQKI
ncbi:hypothetical protein UUR9_0621 [Ureaplasma urealyticum serovar 9 str. ATCC 33175]|nr:hypothetical protein UUR9_0621 [Ureaplasma urealyticum serovar 9 str. ATCC 33175]